MKHFLMLVVILVLSGCSFKHASEFVISTEFDTEQQAAIVAAADEWCEATGVCVPVSVGEPANVLPEHDPDRCPCWGRAVVSTIGDPIIYVCKNAPHFQKTVAHEIGHAISANGEHPTAGVMSAPWDGTEHVSEADAAWLSQFDVL